MRLGIWTSRRNRYQFWISVDFDTPPLVIGEVPMEHVQLVPRHEIEESLYRVHAKEMAAFVQQHPSPLERGEVLDLDARALNRAIANRRQL